MQQYVGAELTYLMYMVIPALFIVEMERGVKYLLQDEKFRKLEENSTSYAIFEMQNTSTVEYIL